MKTHILCSITFFRKSCRLWDNVEKYGRARQATDDNITRRMRFACWIAKATDTHSEYEILIAFPRQQWFREHASMLRYKYIDCPVNVRDLTLSHEECLWTWHCVTGSVVTEGQQVRDETVLGSLYPLICRNYNPSKRRWSLTQGRTAISRRIHSVFSTATDGDRSVTRIRTAN